MLHGNGLGSGGNCVGGRRWPIMSVSSQRTADAEVGGPVRSAAGLVLGVGLLATR
jgi:hypothetical protein